MPTPHYSKMKKNCPFRSTNRKNIFTRRLMHFMLFGWLFPIVIFNVFFARNLTTMLYAGFFCFCTNAVVKIGKRKTFSMTFCWGGNDFQYIRSFEFCVSVLAPFECIDFRWKSRLKRPSSMLQLSRWLNNSYTENINSNFRASFSQTITSLWCSISIITAHSNL